MQLLILEHVRSDLFNVKKKACKVLVLLSYIFSQMLVSPCCLNKCFMEFLNLLLCALLLLVN